MGSYDTSGLMFVHGSYVATITTTVFLRFKVTFSSYICSACHSFSGVTYMWL